MYQRYEKLSNCNSLVPSNGSVPPTAGSAIVRYWNKSIRVTAHEALTPEARQYPVARAGIAGSGVKTWLSRTAVLDLLALNALFGLDRSHRTFNSAVSETLLKVLSPGMNQKL
jgi:hypothetical protein